MTSALSICFHLLYVLDVFMFFLQRLKAYSKKRKKKLWRCTTISYILRNFFVKIEKKIDLQPNKRKMLVAEKNELKHKTKQVCIIRYDMSLRLFLCSIRELNWNRENISKVSNKIFLDSVFNFLCSVNKIQIWLMKKKMALYAFQAYQYTHIVTICMNNKFKWVFFIFGQILLN